jgi:sugar phosphate isomerase/epimerase
MHTRTGHFPIGFRRGWSDWQRDLLTLSNWARESGFAFLDLMYLSAADVKTVESAGVKVGSVDLWNFGDLLGADDVKRKDAVALNLTKIDEMTAAGVKVFFTCMIGDPARKRIDNFKLAVETFGPLCQRAHERGATIALEGYPGGGPSYPSIGCTPETVRTLLHEIPQGLSLNYDPSHLIRLGVDHIRFLSEFIEHVSHVHAKDTELSPEAVYEFGLYQGSAFSPAYGFGEHVWRYCLPGQGTARWSGIFRALKDAKYKGLVSIELEDQHFNGSEHGEQEGLTWSLQFLSGV